MIHEKDSIFTQGLFECGFVIGPEMPFARVPYFPLFSGLSDLT